MKDESQINDDEEERRKSLRSTRKSQINVEEIID